MMGSTSAGDRLSDQTVSSWASTPSWTWVKFGRYGARCAVGSEARNGATASCRTTNGSFLNAALLAIDLRDGMPWTAARPCLMPVELTMYLRNSQAASVFLLVRAMANIDRWKKFARPIGPAGSGATFQSKRFTSRMS